ncbi:MAG: hypothetical protein ACLSAP_11445 [Oscillospiraceae bacterium]
MPVNATVTELERAQAVSDADLLLLEQRDATRSVTAQGIRQFVSQSLAAGDLKGGLHSVASVQEMEAIPPSKRAAGMLVYVQQEETLYQLAGDLASFAPFGHGGQTDGYTKQEVDERIGRLAGVVAAWGGGVL